MSRPALNKSSLKNERDKLRLYHQYLPSLDLKRRQYMSLVKEAEQNLEQIEDAINQAMNDANDWLPFLANDNIDIRGLIEVENLEIRRHNQLGISLPHLKDLRFKKVDYSFFRKPSWIDGLIGLLQEVCRLNLEKKVARRRVSLLRDELRTTTQRVNLFDKVLIPSTRDNIREIDIALSDMERAGVVRAKIAKKKRQKRGV